MQRYRLFDANTKTPRVMPPVGACDSQIHVFGSPDHYPVRSGAAYLTPQATIEAALKMHRTIGISRGVIVQSTAYGSDHRVMLDALNIAGKNYRGCAVIDASTSDDEIASLADAGVCAARFNFVKKLNLVPDENSLLEQIDRLHEFGWHARIHARGDDLVHLAPMLARIRIPAVIDHFGIYEISPGLDQDALKVVRQLLDKGNWWVMLSALDRRSRLGFPWDDLVPFGRSLVEYAPDRVIWGSNWPHPLISEENPMPNDGDLLELAYRYAGTDELIKKLLVDNPNALMKFDG